jgi:heterotetrameric sarcosine oxidase delta subunit
VSHLHIRCPNCGTRPSSEFSYSGETRPLAVPGGPDLDEVDRLWLRRNVAGPQRERWFHSAGCRRFVTLTRDTRTNRILAQPGQDDVATSTGGEGGERRPSH